MKIVDSAGQPEVPKQRALISQHWRTLRAGKTMTGNDIFEVVEIGYGPAGQTQAALLGGAGHRVAVFERHSGLYALPRAGHLDREIMRPQGSLPAECQHRARLAAVGLAAHRGHVEIQVEPMRAGSDGAVRRVL